MFKKTKTGDLLASLLLKRPSDWVTKYYAGQDGFCEEWWNLEDEQTEINITVRHGFFGRYIRRLFVKRNGDGIELTTRLTRRDKRAVLDATSEVLFDRHVQLARMVKEQEDAAISGLEKLAEPQGLGALTSAAIVGVFGSTPTGDNNVFDAAFSRNKQASARDTFMDPRA